MKSRTLLLLCLGLFWSIPAISARPDHPAVEQWGIFELVLQGPSSGNPFADVGLTATFDNGHRSAEVRGFYDGEGIYRVRFMPDEPGLWQYRTRSNVWPLTDMTGRFEVTPAGPGNHGPVRVAHQFHFAYADGTRYYPVGTTTYNWLHRPAETQEATLRTLASSPFNKLRMLIFPERLGVRSPPGHFPFVGTPPDNWDYSRFNPAYFRAIEKRIADLRDLGIEADLILFHKYGPEWGFDTMTDAVDDAYLRYLVARFAAYRNVWWSVANEYDFVKTKTEEDWDRYFRILQAEDPYNHLRSIHNGFLIYDNNKPWVTHASIQNGSAVEEAGRAQLYRDVWRKPVVYDEVKYEGDIDRRWGQLGAGEMVHRFWAGTVAGTYVGHGECYRHPSQVIWLSTGGVLRGESPPRIDFLRKILESAPGYIDPVDKWQDTRTGGVPGEFYLLYFGREAPGEWAFSLPQAGVREGQVYTVDVVDTWNMTITPVEGSFIATGHDRYRFVDKDERTIKLPGKPYMALIIRRVGGDSAAVVEEDPNA